MINIEVSAYSASWALAAQECGAQRVELCANILEGGTTPSIGCMQLVREKLHIKLFVIVRPRGGDFIYNDYEIETIYKDIEHIKRIGADGVVIGLLNQERQVEIGITRELVNLARPMEVTFHRAFDKVANPFQALEEVIETGCNRVLSSGHKPTAIEGVDLLVQLQKQSKGRIGILPGSGINEQNIKDLWLKTNLNEFHLSAKKKTSHTLNPVNESIHFNLIAREDETNYDIDTVVLKRITELAKSFTCQNIK